MIFLKQSLFVLSFALVFVFQNVSVRADESLTIIDQLKKKGEFTTLLKAIDAAGLSETLRSSGPYTLLAPNDEAFALVPEDVLQDLLAPGNKQKLAAVLSTHVLDGKIKANDIFKNTTVTNLRHKQLAVKIVAGNYMVDFSKLIQADFACSNGLIQIIDRVILPLEF